jgi:tetratricopeptide (TPR) repeat protein
VRRRRARAHVTNGILLYKEEMDIYSAEAELGIAADMDSDYPLALYYHAQLLSTHGRYDKALERLKAAVKLKPKYKEKAWKADEFESLRRDLRFQAIVEKKPFFP